MELGLMATGNLVISYVAKVQLHIQMVTITKENGLIAYLIGKVKWCIRQVSNILGNGIMVRRMVVVYWNMLTEIFMRGNGLMIREVDLVNLPFKRLESTTKASGKMIKWKAEDYSFKMARLKKAFGTMGI